MDERRDVAAIAAAEIREDERDRGRRKERTVAAAGFSVARHQVGQSVALHHLGEGPELGVHRRKRLAGAVHQPPTVAERDLGLGTEDEALVPERDPVGAVQPRRTLGERRDERGDLRADRLAPAGDLVGTVADPLHPPVPELDEVAISQRARHPVADVNQLVVDSVELRRPARRARASAAWPLRAARCDRDPLRTAPARRGCRSRRDT